MKILLLIFLFFMPFIGFTQKRQAEAEVKKIATNLRLSFLNLFLGKLSLQYEIKMQRHAININGNLSFTDAKPGYLAGLGYRYYLTDNRSSAFIGIMLNFSDYRKRISAETLNPNTQQGTGQTSEFRLLGQTLVAGLNFGYRKSLFLGLCNITVRGGYGYPIGEPAWKDGNAPADQQSYVRSFKFQSGLDGEISFGVNF